MEYNLIAYALDFSSFLLERLGGDANKLNQIILFGSVARGEADEKSDIDLFIGINEKFQDKIDKIKNNFYDSIKFKKYWSLLNIKNEINLSIGKLEEWGDLQRSIIANGIVLYGKYFGELKTEQYYLFIVSSGENRNKNISIWRELYGYTQKVNGKDYIKKGIVLDYSGKKLSRGVFIIPLDNSQKVIRYLRENKVSFKVIPVGFEKNGRMV